MRHPPLCSLHEHPIAIVKTLRRLESMIKDAAALLDDARPEDFDVDIHCGDDEIRELVGAYEESSAVERQASQNLAIASRKAVCVMRSKGIPVQDIANLLGVTPGRVSQLAKQP